MSFVTGMKCRECGESYAVGAHHVCEFCFGPLEVQYDYDAVARVMTRAAIEATAAQHLALPRAAAGRT